MFNVIAVVLGVLAIFVYVKGVRYDKGWAAPLMTLLVLGAVVAVILPMTGMRRRMQQRRWEQLRFKNVELIGQALGPKLSPGARVLLIREPDIDFMYDDFIHEDELEEEELIEIEHHRALRQEELDRIRRRFEQEARISINLVADVSPQFYPENDADSFNEIIEPYREDGLDLIISLLGPPMVYGPEAAYYELERLSCHNWENPPLIAVDVGSHYDPDMLREYIREGYLAAVVLRRPETDYMDRIVIDSSNLDSMPDNAPYGL